MKWLARRTVKNDPLILGVKRNGNRVDVVGGPRDLFYEIDGLTLPPIENWGFCVWHTLAWAMRRGASIHVAGPVDEGTISSAQQFTRIWELWNPRRFRFVKITSDGTAPTPKVDRRNDLVMFSGGLDSVDMLLRIGRRPNPGLALTVQGFDEELCATSGFKARLAKTRPLLADLNYNQAVVRTNAASVVHDYHSWGLRLMGIGSLLSPLFKEGVFAADRTIEQDIAVGRWGNNHIANRLLRSSDFALRQLCHKISRSEKVSNVAAHPIALNGLTFCNNYGAKPRREAALNCGMCEKCVRTKAMFAVEKGAIPNIFVDMSLPKLDRLTLNDKESNERVEVAFFIDLYQRARELGTLAHVPGLDRKFFATFGDKPEPEPLRTTFRDLLPASVVSKIRAVLGRRVVYE
jgi:hypothetical protein